MEIEIFKKKEEVFFSFWECWKYRKGPRVFGILQRRTVSEEGEELKCEIRIERGKYLIFIFIFSKLRLENELLSKGVLIGYFSRVSVEAWLILFLILCFLFYLQALNFSIIITTNLLTNNELTWKYKVLWIKEYIFLKNMVN